MLPLVAGTAAAGAATAAAVGAVVVAAEPPAAGVPGNVAACCATNAEFKRGLRVEVPGEGGRERNMNDY